MKDLIIGAEAVSLFCRLNINTKRDLPIRSSEMGLLIYIVKNDVPVTSVEAARFFRVSKPMVSTMVRSLEGKEYLERQQSKNNRRSYILLPTKAAVELVEETYEEYYRTMEMLCKGMGAEEFNNLVRSLRLANKILLRESEDLNG